MPASVIFNHPHQTSPSIYCDEIHAARGNKVEGNHFQWSLSLTLGGGCHYETSGSAFEVRTGDLMLLRPRITTQWQAGVHQRTSPDKYSGWHVLYVVFEPRPHWYALLDWPTVAAGVSLLHLSGEHFSAEIRRLLKKTLSTYRQGHIYRDDMALLRLEELLLVLAMHEAWQTPVFDARVEAALQFIRSNFGHAITLQDIGRAAHVSVSQLCLLFSQQVGMSPMKFAENERLNFAARQLCYSGDLVGHIALACGFSDAGYFTRRFREKTGETPRSFRNRVRTNLTGSNALPTQKLPTAL